ncbi:MucBP domain-containing protein [Enterococcus faecalis]
MKKLTSVLALSTILLGGLSPTIQGIAETAELSGTSNDIGVENGHASEESTQESNVIDTKSTRPVQDVDESSKKESSNVNNEDNQALTNPIHETQSETTRALNEKSWLATELDDNQAFIDATVTAVNKPESDIQKSDLENIKKLVVTGASSIPEKISDYIALEDLDVSNGTVSSIPDGLYSLNKTLQFLGLRNNHFIVLPEKLFDDSFWIGKSNGLTLFLDNNQIVSDVPNNTGVAGMLNYNSRNNMLEYFNKTDYHNNPQGQLMYQGRTPTINVPVGYDFNANTPDTTNLSLYVTNAGYQPLFPGHEFVYYDDGSSSVIQNGVATHSGSGKIWVKSKFSTLTNPFARTQIKVNVEAPAVAGDVTVKYEDLNGVSISDDVVKSGNIGEAYTTEQKDIPGYTFKEVQGNPTGKFTNQTQTVTYVYTKDPIAGGNVTVSYVDTEGNKISEDVVKTGNVGETYTTEQKAIPGYSFKEVQGNPTGQFTNKGQKIIYIYKKNKSLDVITNSNKNNTPTTPGKSTNIELDNFNRPTVYSFNKKTLPKTGENNKFYFESVLLGSSLSFLTSFILYYRLKRQKVK